MTLNFCLHYAYQKSVHLKEVLIKIRASQKSVHLKEIRAS